MTVRCTQLPLWKVSYCCSSISTLHSYQPWSSERTFSIRREDLPCRLARPGQERQRCSVSRKGHRGEKDGWIEFNEGNEGKAGKGERRMNKEKREEKHQMNVKERINL